MSTFPSLRTAAKYAGVTYQTIRTWSKEYDIGSFENGHWVIDKEKLDRVIEARDQIEEIRSSLKPE